jgi:low affinity Fe/Cu permease
MAQFGTSAIRPAQAETTERIERHGSELPPLPLFARFSRQVERVVGQAGTFAFAAGVVVVWAASGPVFGWSDTWQLVINTGTTIVTFLMVFIIQNTQSRDTAALQLKLDELLRVSAGRNSMINLEELSEDEIKRLQAKYRELRLDSAPAAPASEEPAPSPSRAEA